MSQASTVPSSSSGVSFPHRRQIKEWDCGAACAYSLLRGLDDAARAAAVDASASAAAAAASSSSPRSSSSLLYGELLHALSPCEQRIWTIDLAFLLCCAGVRGVRMISARLGVDPAHGLKTFYDHFAEDQRRVDRVFAAAAARTDITVTQQRLSGLELAHLVRGGHCCILLVDQRLVNCDHCYTTEQQRERLAAPEFAGHFIFVVGVDAEDLAADGASADPMVRFIDPDAKHAPCSIRLSALDRARLSDGTDEDCILVDCTQNRDVRIVVKGRMAIGLGADEPKTANPTQQPNEAAPSSGLPTRKAPGSSSVAIMPSLGRATRRSTRRVPQPENSAASAAASSASALPSACMDDGAAIGALATAAGSSSSTSSSSAAAAAAAAASSLPSAATAAVSAACVSSPIVLLPAGSVLPGLSKPDLQLLRAKQRRIRASVASTLRTLPGGAAAPLSLRTALASSVVFAQHEAGSGVCVHPDGWILTCAHCIGESSKEWKANKHKWLLFSSGQAVRTVCVVWDEKRDLALQRIIAVELEAGNSSGSSSSNLPPFPFVSLSPSPPTLHAPLLCIGQPGSEDLEADSSVSVKTHYALVCVSEGAFQGLVPGADPHDNHEIGTMKHDAWTYWGHSGAPLLLLRPQQQQPQTEAAASAASASAASSSSPSASACVSSSSQCPLLVGLHSSWDDESGMRHGVPHAAIEALLQRHLPPLSTVASAPSQSSRARAAPDADSTVESSAASSKRQRRTHAPESSTPPLPSAAAAARIHSDAVAS